MVTNLNLHMRDTKECIYAWYYEGTGWGGYVKTNNHASTQNKTIIKIEQINLLTIWKSWTLYVNITKC